MIYIIDDLYNWWFIWLPVILLGNIMEIDISSMEKMVSMV